jgi:transcriptional regulator with XRE-family HTH domain
MTFAERLRELRKAAGLTQDQLNERSGLPIGTLRNYEQGVRQPLWHVLFKLAKALGVDCTAFADCEDVQADEAAPAAPAAKGGKGKRRSKK